MKAVLIAVFCSILSTLLSCIINSVLQYFAKKKKMQKRTKKTWGFERWSFVRGSGILFFGNNLLILNGVRIILNDKKIYSQ